MQLQDQVQELRRHLGTPRQWSLHTRLTVGTYSLLVFLIQRLLWPLTRLGATVDLYQRALASTTRILDLLDARPKVESGATPLPRAEVKGEVRFEAVRFEYVAGHPVIVGMRESPDDLEGHVYVAHEVVFRELQRSKVLGIEQTGPPIYAIERLTLVDPKKPIGQVETRTGQRVKETLDFMISRPSAREALEEQIRARRESAARSNLGTSGNKSTKELWKKWFD